MYSNTFRSFGILTDIRTEPAGKDVGSKSWEYLTVKGSLSAVMQYNTMSKYMYIIFLLNLSKKFDVKMQGLLRQCEKNPAY